MFCARITMMYVTRLHFYHRNQHDTERKHMTKWTFCIIRNTEKQTEKNHASAMLD